MDTLEDVTNDLDRATVERASFAIIFLYERRTNFEKVGRRPEVWNTKASQKLVGNGIMRR